MATGSEATIKIKAKDDTGKAFKAAKSGLKSVGDFAQSTQAQIASLVGAAGFGALIQSNLDTAASTKKVSDALGMNVEDLSAWQYAVRGTKVDADKIGDILKDVSEKIGDAFRNGGGEALEVIESLGLNLNQLAAMSPDKQLLEIAGALDQVGTQSEKVMIMESLGSDLSLLLPLLDDNAAGFKSARIEAEELNAILTTESAVAAEKYKDDLEKLKATTNGLALEMGTKALPALNNITGAMVEAAKDAGVLTALWVGLGGAAVELFELEGSAADMAAKTAEANARREKSLRDTQAALTSNNNTMAESGRVVEELEVRLNALNGMESVTAETRAIVSQELEKEKQKYNEAADAVAKLTGELERKQAAQQQSVAVPELAAMEAPAGLSDKDRKAAEALEKLRLQQEEKYAVMVEGFAGEMELTYIHQEEKKAMLDEWRANESITEWQHQTGLTLIDQEGATARKRIAELEKKSKLAIASGMMGNLTALMASGSRQQFEIGKTAAIAQATIKGGQAIVSAFEAGMSTGGPWAPAIAAAYAASAAIATGAQISSIQSTQFSGGGSISPAGGGGVSAGGGQLPVAPVPPALNGGTSRSTEPAGELVLRGVEPSQMFTGQQVRDLAERIAESGATGVSFQ